MSERQRRAETAVRRLFSTARELFRAQSVPDAALCAAEAMWESLGGDVVGVLL